MTCAQAWRVRKASFEARVRSRKLNEMGQPVTLAIYDLSNGLARELSPVILGKRIDGIWHTGIRVYDREYYFGGGICMDAIGSTPYGSAASSHVLGTTSKSRGDFEQFLQTLQSRFSISSYHLLDNNCNHFSDCCAMFLVNSHIPQYILDLPGEALNSAIGPMLRPMVDGMQRAIIEQSMSHQVNFNNASANSVSTSTGAGNAASNTAPSASSGARDAFDSNRVFDELVNNPVKLGHGNVSGIRNKLKSIDGSLPTTIRNGEDANALIKFALHGSASEVFAALDLLRLTLASIDGEASENSGTILERVCESLLQLIEKFGVGDYSDATYGAQLMTIRLAVNVFAVGGSNAKVVKNTDLVDGAVEACEHALSAWRDTSGMKDSERSRRLSVAAAGAILLRNVCTAIRREKVVLEKDGEAEDEDEGVTTRLLFMVHEFVSERANESSASSNVNGDCLKLVCSKVVTPVLQATVLLTHENALAKDVLHAYEFDSVALKLIGATKTSSMDEDWNRVTRCLVETVLVKL